MDIGLVTPFPHRFHNANLGSATAKLLIEVSELHAGDNGRLEIRCQSTIPAFVTHHEQYADIRIKTVEGIVAFILVDRFYSENIANRRKGRRFVSVLIFNSQIQLFFFFFNLFHVHPYPSIHFIQLTLFPPIAMFRILVFPKL